MTSLKELAEREALLAEAEHHNLEVLADWLWIRREELRAAMMDLGLLEDPGFVPTSRQLHVAREKINAEGPGESWDPAQLANPGPVAKTIGWIRRNGWPSMRDGRFIPPSKEDTMAKKVEGKHTLEVTERELYELRQGIRKREHELELAHEYMNNKGLSTAAADERLLILRGKGPDQPGLMHRLGFVDSEIKAVPDTEDPDQLELVQDDEEGSDG